MMRDRRHPTTAELTTLALDGKERAGTQIVTHARSCYRCAGTVESIRRLAAVARQMTSPEAPRAVLDRVLAARAAGVRTTRPPRGGRGTWRLAAATAAAVLLLLAHRLITRIDSRRDPAAAVTPTRTEDCMRSFPYGSGMGTWLLAVACAQEPTATAPPVAGLAADELRAGRWTYESVQVEDGVMFDWRANLAVAVTSSSYGDEPTWQIVSDVSNPAGTWIETIQVGRFDLAPKFLSVYRSVSPEPRLLLTGTFTSNTVRMIADARGQRRDTVLRLPDAEGLVIVGTGELAIVPHLLPLHRTWRGSVTSGWPHRGAINLHVNGEQHVEVPAGRFACWVVEREDVPGAYQVTWWVDQDTGWLIKWEERGTSLVTTTVLTSAEVEPGS